MHRIALQDGKIIDINIEPAKDVRSFFAFGINRAGSTLLDRIMRDICTQAEVASVSINRELFQRGIPIDVVRLPQEIFHARGFCYRGFRWFWPAGTGFPFRNHKKVLLVRDPRDVMISAYWSAKLSHSIPNVDGSEIAQRMQEKRRRLEAKDDTQDAHIEFAHSHAPKLKEKFQSYLRNLDENTRVYRYEDVIFRKEDWIKSIASYVGVPIENEAITRIARAHDVVPESENPNKHIRSVIPGNHRRHYGAPILQWLTQYFDDELGELGYREVAWRRIGEANCRNGS